ncbi:MAG: hypothetical protein IJU58_03975 [Clostridia bacterium]|nr:hypothetical protein [Clostridia bacterium]
MVVLKDLFGLKQKRILNDCVVIIGPAGVGKSYVSEELAKQTGMPLITMDLLRHCPNKIKDIKRKKAELEENIKELEEKLNQKKNYQGTKISKMLDNCKKELIITDEQLNMRCMFPDLPNYEQMGFNEEVSQRLLKEYSPVVWHFYQKQFETTLMQNVFKQIDRPCIIDMGGGMPIALEEEYRGLAEHFKRNRKEWYAKNFDLSKCRFITIKNMFSHFGVVVNLEPPKEADEDSKFIKDPLNKWFLDSGQYHELATDNIDTNRLLEGGAVSDAKLKLIVSNILGIMNKDTDTDAIAKV